MAIVGIVGLCHALPVFPRAACWVAGTQTEFVGISMLLLAAASVLARRRAAPTALAASAAFTSMQRAAPGLLGASCPHPVGNTCSSRSSGNPGDTFGRPELARKPRVTSGERLAFATPPSGFSDAPVVEWMKIAVRYVMTSQNCRSFTVEATLRQ
jgi:hypothetical protein